jgi:hypothetical protein
MRFILLFLASAAAVTAQSVSFGGVFGASLTNDYTTFSFPIQLVPDPLGGGNGFDQSRSSGKHAILGVMTEIEFTHQFAVEVDALHRPNTLHIGFLRADGTPLGPGGNVQTSSWEFPLLAKYRLGLPLSPFIEAGPSFRPAGSGSSLSHFGITAGAGFEIHSRLVNILPALRYTRWREIEFIASHGIPDQLEFVLGFDRRAESARPEVLGHRLAVGVIAGIGLGDDVRTARGDATVIPDSPSPLAGATLEARLVRDFFLEVDGIYHPLHFREPEFGSFVHQAVLTWEVPVLFKYKFRARRLRPIIEGGPAFRATGNLNGSQPSTYGAAGGLGVETALRRLKISPEVRYTRWARDAHPNDAFRPQTLPNRVELLVGFSF